MQMPKLSDTMKHGVVAKWLKKEGDKVVSGSPIVEIETDKATMEFESPSTGILLKIIVNDTESCELQAPIAVIGKQNESWEDALKNFNVPTKTETAPLKIKESSPVVSSIKTEVSSSSESQKIKLSPLARKLAKEKGMDIEKIQGSGPQGRIVLKDILEQENTPSEMILSAISSSPNKIPLTSMRQAIARRLTESVVTAPHFYLKVRINMENILNWRSKNKDVASLNDIILFMTSRALTKHKDVNSSWQGDHIMQYSDVNLCIAVALPAGLVTPVLKQAQLKSLSQIAKESKELILKAQTNKLTSQDHQGGTFTLSNLGMMGIDDFTAIINPPQAAILAIGQLQPLPFFDGDDVSWKKGITLTLSCDHRVIDGAIGAQFLQTLKTYFEDPLSALFL